MNVAGAVKDECLIVTKMSGLGDALSSFMYSHSVEKAQIKSNRGPCSEDGKLLQHRVNA